MNVRLVVDYGARRSVLKLTHNPSFLGRAKGNTVRIPSPAVSRRHCRLFLDQGLLTVEDLDSINGTFLNGQRIKDARVVRPGDHLEVGPVKFLVEYVLTPEAMAALRARDGTSDIAMLEEVQDVEYTDLSVEEENLEPVLLDVGDDSGLIKPDFDDLGPEWAMPADEEVTQLDTDPPKEKKTEMSPTKKKKKT